MTIYLLEFEEKKFPYQIEYTIKANYNFDVTIKPKLLI